jgi:hypothetical protein
MIGTLPTLYPEELLYSWWARHCDRMQYPSKRSAIQELFGTVNVIASVELPSHIDDFVAALSPGHHYSADDLIDNHTLLPFYAPFLPPERLRHLREDMRGRNGPAIYRRSGVMASQVSSPGWLRLCPHCVEEDRRLFGECYWHRVHQAPGVEVCPVHEVRLCQSTVRTQNVKTRYAFVPAESVAQALDQSASSEAPDEILLKIARDAYWLLNSRGLSQSLKALNARYHKKLSALSFTSYRGRTDVNALLESFRSCYHSDLLRLLQCELEEHVNANWLLRLVRTPRNAQHPLHHLLLIHFLGYTAETFFILDVERKPFGQGPWPCLNPASNHYRQSQIEKCSINYSQHVSGKPVGTFSCSCGFIYTRTGPDTSTENRFKLSKVKAFGHIWENRLRALWVDETVSLRGIARQLGVDPLTVKRQATRLGLLFPRPVCQSLPLKETQQLQPRITSEPELVQREAYRATWLAAMRDNPAAGVKILRNKVGGIYTWLYRNDLLWLKEHMLFRKKAKPSLPRVDWNKRDRQLAESVKVSALRLISAPGPPVRVTISSIGGDIGQRALLQQHLDKLPLTTHVLADLVETREGFAVRRIQWAAIQYRHEGFRPQRWELIRRAGVDRLKAHYDIRIAIDEAIQDICEESEIKH